MESIITSQQSRILPGATSVDTGKDILGYLQSKWLEGESRSDEAQQAVQAFIDESRKVMRSERPIGIDHMSFTLALRYENNTVLRYCDADPELKDQPAADKHGIAFAITG